MSTFISLLMFQELLDNRNNQLITFKSKKTPVHNGNILE